MSDEGSNSTNLSLLVGQLQGGFREIRQMLVDQNQQHVRDKEEAIQERERRHEENKTELRKMGSAIDSTAVIAQANARWIADRGEPIAKRFEAMETKTRTARLLALGGAKVWALIGAAILAVGGAVFEYGGAALELIKSGLHGR